MAGQMTPRGGRGRRAVAALAGSLVAGLLAGSVALPATAASPAGLPGGLPGVAAVMPGPDALGAGSASARDDVLDGVSCTSASSCVSVGWYKKGTVYRGLSELWAGTAWSVRPVQTPARKNQVTFPGEVSCGSPGSCMLVGAHYRSARSPVLLAETWNGSRWVIAASANPAGATSSALGDVACAGTAFCMTVGQEVLRSGRTQAIARAWNGHGWGPVTVPAPPRARLSELGGLACATATSCMAVGGYELTRARLLTYAARWDGSRWKILPTPSVPHQAASVFNAVSCPTPARCVAVGFSNGRQGEHPLIETWSNGRWQRNTISRLIVRAGLAGVSCPDATHCVAVGWDSPAALIEVDNGSGWRMQTPPFRGKDNSNTLLHVSCTTPSNCEAVGTRFKAAVPLSNRTLAEIWDGQHWAVQPAPSP